MFGMINSILGESTFRKGITVNILSNLIKLFLGIFTPRALLFKNYLKKYALSSTTQDSLWDSFTQQGLVDGTLDQKLTIKEIMDTWTSQRGYPLVTVTRTGNKLVIKQSGFLLYLPKTIKIPDDFNQSRWFIPFTYTTKEQLDWRFESKPNWFRPEQQECKKN